MEHFVYINGKKITEKDFRRMSSIEISKYMAEITIIINSAIDEIKRLRSNKENYSKLKIEKADKTKRVLACALRWISVVRKEVRMEEHVRRSSLWQKCAKELLDPETYDLIDAHFNEIINNRL